MALQLAVCVSGGGSNLQSLIDAVEDGRLDADIRLVFSNRPGAGGLDRAKRHGIPSLALSHKEFSRQAFDRAMADAIAEAGADTVALAGFMRLLTPAFLKRFPDRVVNIHPALLPAFPGADGQGDAAAYGVTLAGCTVHFVDEKVDHGPIIIQAAVPAYPGEGRDALQPRILELEHRVFPQALQWLSQGRLELRGRHVALRGAGTRPTLDAQGGFMVHPPLEPGF